MEKLFCRAKEQGILVCADMTKPKNGEQEKDIAGALRWVDYFFPNREEACMLTRETDEEKAAVRLLNAGVKHVVIKCGGDGCLVACVCGAKAVECAGAARWVKM